MKGLFTGKKITLFLHLLAWAIILALPVYLVQQWKVGKDFMWFYYATNILSGIIFYLNYLVIVPRFFFRTRRSIYFLWVFVMLVIFYFISGAVNESVFRYVNGNQNIEEMKRTEMKSEQDRFADRGRDEHRPGPRPPFLIRPFYRQMHLINYSFTSLFLVFFSLGLRVLEKQSQIERTQKELEKEKLNSELAFLKNQISPHFFFNTLNNIYSLIAINADDSQKAVLKLSKLMRYLLYESEHGNTKLSSEISFMKNYIDLMRLRMTDKVNLKIDFPEEYEDIDIPPLLFIPFIENAFKHGISNRGNSYIDIELVASKTTIGFRCQNSTVNNKSETDEVSGIGLENIRKRLNLLFPGKHRLTISQTDISFAVNLDIDFGK